MNLATKEHKEHKGGVMLALAAILLALCPSRVMADDFSAAFQSANKLYEENKFAEAASAYQKLVESGKASSALFFNLGNALFKAGQIGRAIVAYREAEQLAPRDPDVRANLQFARNQPNAASEPVATLARKTDDQRMDDAGKRNDLGVVDAAGRTAMEAGMETGDARLGCRVGRRSGAILPLPGGFAL